MRKRIKEKLSNDIEPEGLTRVYNSFDIIGNIAIIKTQSCSLDEAEVVAKKIMMIHRNVKTVFTQTSSIKSPHRTRELTFLAGEKTTTTMYKESGCVFSVDVEKCYFSPRLSYERLRIANQISPKEIVVNMFSGVGCFSIIIAKTVDHTQVYSIDLNPVAFKYMQDNVRLNRVYGKVYPLLGDSKIIIENCLQHVADRILMPLPERALEYLPSALLSLKNEGGWIHYYDFQHAVGKENPCDKTKKKIAEKLSEIGASYVFSSARIVRSTGPNWYQTSLDIHITALPSKF